ncbi:MAG: TonB-dependent receptor [Bacteroidales bacterium]|nr:TonB-dependent receptor [Bacteroidales bacterium]
MKSYRNRLPIRHGLFSLCLTLFCTLVNAQGAYAIRGKVSDESGQPVAYANIVLRDAEDSTLFGGTISNETGNFNFRLQVPGKYLLNASFIGYESADTIIRPVGEVTDAGNIVLRREHHILNEAVIRKSRKRAKQQVDLTTYYVNSNMRSASETGVDLISQVPGVRVDLMNTISLNGSQQIKILVNGVERDAEYLGQLDAARIDRIDIRSTGGLQYDASISGVINVILKKEVYEGISGHVYANIPTKRDEVFSFPSASISYSRKNTTWYTSYNGSFSKFRIEGNNQKILYPENDSREIIRTDSLRQENWSHKLHFGVDHFSNEKTQLSLYGFISGFSNEQDGQVEIKQNAKTSEPKTYLFQKDDLDKNGSVYGSVYLKHQFSPSSMLTLEGNAYLLSSQTGLFLTSPENNLRQISQSEPSKNKTNLRARFSSKISENVSIESGIEEQWLFLQDNLLPSFKYSERIFAGYLQGALALKSFHLQGGIRTEHSRVIYSDVLDEKRVFLLPEVDLKYNFNRKNSLRINYGKRINRPQIHQLNPNPYTIDLFSLQQGNPGLTPEIIRNLSAMHSVSFRENYLATKIFYRQESSVIEDLTMLTDSGSLRMEKQNMGDLNYTGVKVLGSINLHDNFSMNSNIECYHVQTRVNALAKNQGVANQSGLEIRGDMSAIWAIKKDLSLSASLQFQSSAIGIQRQYREGALYFISLDKVFFKHVKVELTSALPFKRSFTYQGYDINTDAFTVTSEDKIKLSVVPVWFKIKYSFPSGSEVRHLKRDNVFEEKRVKKGF